jgi:hypothetical protein
MKQKVGPIAIVVGILFVALVAYASYRFAFQAQSPHASPDNAPGYVKARRDGNTANTAPGASGTAAGGDAGASSNAPAYGQGAGYQRGGGPGGMERPGGGPPSGYGQYGGR